MKPSEDRDTAKDVRPSRGTGAPGLVDADGASASTGTRVAARLAPGKKGFPALGQGTAAARTGHRKELSGFPRQRQAAGPASPGMVTSVGSSGDPIVLPRPGHLSLGFFLSLGSHLPCSPRHPVLEQILALLCPLQEPPALPGGVPPFHSGQQYVWRSLCLVLYPGNPALCCRENVSVPLGQRARAAL